EYPTASYPGSVCCFRVLAGNSDSLAHIRLFHSRTPPAQTWQPDWIVPTPGSDGTRSRLSRGRLVAAGSGHESGTPRHAAHTGYPPRWHSHISQPLYHDPADKGKPRNSGWPVKTVAYMKPLS